MYKKLLNDENEYSFMHMVYSQNLTVKKWLKRVLFLNMFEVLNY